MDLLLLILGTAGAYSAGWIASKRFHRIRDGLVIAEPGLKVCLPVGQTIEGEVVLGEGTTLTLIKGREDGLWEESRGPGVCFSTENPPPEGPVVIHYVGG